MEAWDRRASARVVTKWVQGPYPRSLESRAGGPASLCVCSRSTLPREGITLLPVATSGSRVLLATPRGALVLADQVAGHGQGPEQGPGLTREE